MKARTLTMLLIGLLLSSSPVWSQEITVHFTYDDCGNRVLRHLDIEKIEENGKAVEAGGLLEVASDYIGGLEVFLYPNPTGGNVTVTLSDDTPAPLEAILTTVTGVVVEHHRFNGLRHDFDLSSQPAGIYLLKLILIDETRTWKIVKH